ncbi:MFS transporter [Pseudomonas extremorientalis]|jgi:predicted MFS family arabinose efflux permease|uniref:MFS transporter n=1 Tax=Pseudomonas extremorientalis TaxID=169669 RepID=A0A1H0SA30_9PSED|nr:MFS transporter [Pseudomonas extremorientalis]KAB0510824.1 multidrug effflux MFS transporter [Pseudomonas extremorientalis]OIN08410.1 MFS transporter [Pseudomonas extremorientalis]WLG56567.1 MFS transporter [Pseudomonas extremorientalis]SDP38661.1 Predicted arabinose efflux permease, MFS family [Pseudomonas extremorientalis]
MSGPYLSRFILITCISLISFFPINILLPSFPALAARFDTPSAEVALSISLFTLVFSISQLIAGPLSDKWGRKEVLLGCITLSILGAIGCAMATDYLTFLLFRSVQALGCGFFVLGHALVEDLFEEQDRARVRLYYMTLSGSFVALSPLIGSWLQTTFDWQGSFYGFAVMALGMLIHALCILPSKSASPRRTPVSIIGTLKAVARNRDFLRYWWIAALVFACYFALISVTPLIFMDALKLSEYQYALVLMVYGVAYLLGGVAASYLQKRIALSRQINIGLGLLLVAGVLLTLIVSLDAITTVTLLIPMLISALAVTLVRPAAISAAMLLFSSSAGTAASAGNSIMFLTAAISSAALAQTGSNLLMSIALSFIVFSLWGWLTNARTGR